MPIFCCKYCCKYWIRLLMYRSISHFFRLLTIYLLGSKDSWRPFGPTFLQCTGVWNRFTGETYELAINVLPSCQSLSMTVWPRRGSLARRQTSRTKVVGSRLNRWKLTSSELRTWGGGGRCAAGKVRPGHTFLWYTMVWYWHTLLGQSLMPLPPRLRQTTPFQSLRKSCLAYFYFGCILVCSLGKTYISHFR